MPLFSFHKPAQEDYEGLQVLSDPGVHGPAAAEIASRLSAGARVLEIGAGAGAFTKRLLRQGYEVDAIDIDDSRFAVEGVRFQKVLPSDKWTEIYGRGAFDAVVAVEVVEHLSSTLGFLQQAYDLLKPGGYVFLTTPNLSSFYSRVVFLKEGRFFHFQGRDSWKNGHINPVPYFVIEQLGEDVGFRLQTRLGLGYMPVVDWSRIRVRNLLTAIPRLVLYGCMGGPGPKEGNSLFYCFQKSDENSHD